MMKTIRTAILALSFSLGMSACGGANGVVDPITLFSDNSIPKLNAIVANGFVGSNLFAGFSPSAPYWILNGSLLGAPVVAPANGIVTSTGITTINGSSLTYVATAHSGRISTAIYGMQNVIVRAGDSVRSGDTLGSFVGVGNQVAFQVLLDGAPICPLSFMSDAFRITLGTSFFGSIAPCL
jgi:hypothetical protein